MSTHVRFPEHSQGSAIEVLESPDHGCGTVCPLNCDSVTFASPSLGGYLRHFCSLRLCTLWLCFNGAVYKHSYLLTYFTVQAATRKVSWTDLRPSCRAERMSCSSCCSWVVPQLIHLNGSYPLGLCQVTWLAWVLDYKLESSNFFTQWLMGRLSAR